MWVYTSKHPKWRTRGLSQVRIMQIVIIIWSLFLWKCTRKFHFIANVLMRNSLFYFKWWKWLLKRWRTRNFLWRPEITVPTYSFLFWSVERILTIYHGSVIMRSMLGIGVSTMSEYLQQGRMDEMFHWLTILVAFIMAGPLIRQRLFCR